MAHQSPRLIDYLGIGALREFQQMFEAVTGFSAVIVDADDRPIAPPDRCERHADHRAALRKVLEEDGVGDMRAPIETRFGRVGAMCIRDLGSEDGGEDHRAEAVLFLHLMADAVARMWEQGRALRQRVHETAALYRLSTLLAGQRDLQSVLDTVVEEVTHLLNAKAASIRLLDEGGEELVIAAAHNLSPAYLNKGRLLLAGSAIDQESLAGRVAYVADMSTDRRVRYPQDAKREGLGSIISTGMVYRGRPVGVMRVYSEGVREFDEQERALLGAIAQAAGAAIRNSQLAAEQVEAARVMRQVEMASDVQRRLMPVQSISKPPFDVAGRYDPCFELGGDFYDVIPLGDDFGVVVGDVVGKGIAASLLMASVRASMRAHAESIYDIDRIIARTNVLLTHDTLDNEFATVFYGTFDRGRRKLTYCSAGHDPALLYRDGQFVSLDVGGMVMGVDAEQRYQTGEVELQTGDVVLIHTDGVTDAFNFDDEKFGGDRLREAVVDKADGTAADVANHVLWQVRRFVGLKHQIDDITIVVVKVE